MNRQKTTVNVLYVSYDGMTDPLGQSQVIPYLLKLAQKGYRFTLLSCEKKERYAKYKNSIENILAPAGIIWEPVFYTKHPPVVSTVYDYFKLLRRADRLEKQNRFQLVH